MKKSPIVGFNHDWVKSVSKEEFLKSQSHIADVEFLSEEYDKIVPPKKDEKEKAKA
jgi:hypothetical protein